MDIIKEELNFIKKDIIKELSDPLPDKNLTSFLSNGSKSIRSSLAVLYLKTQGCEIDENIYNVLCATEIIHNASLLHDDVLDNAETRRGEKTIGKLFSPKIAILAGDYLLAYAIKKIIKLNNQEILYLFQNCTKSMAEAEIKQYFLRGKISNKKDYLEICNNKTGKLFSTALKSCAILKNLSQNEANTFGELFGIFFQIKNDLNKDSAKIDKKNEIYTAKDILGIEKTIDLLDNYKQEMFALLDKYPKNIYKNSLEDLIESI